MRGAGAQLRGLMFKPPPFRVADRTPRRPSFLKKERARRRAYPSCSLPWASARPPFLWGADAHVGAASAEFHVEMARSRGGAVSTKPHRHFPNPACSCHTPLSSWRCVVGGLQGAAAARQPPTFGVRGPGRTAPPSDPGIPSSGDFASVQSEVRPLPARCPLAPSRFSRAGAIVRLWNNSCALAFAIAARASKAQDHLACPRARSAGSPITPSWSQEE